MRDKKGFMKKVKKGEAGLMIAEITDKTPFDGYTDPERDDAPAGVSKIAVCFGRPAISRFTLSREQNLAFRVTQKISHVKFYATWKAGVSPYLHYAALRSLSNLT